MDRLSAIEAFVAVARHGGFSAAARELGQPVATISRQVAQLEHALGARLLTRSTRHVALTEAGLDYHESCERLLRGLREADEQVTGAHRRPQGRLRLTAPLGFGHQHLQPVLFEFLRAYPEVDVELRLSDRLSALVEEQVDCALRISVLADSSLIARRLGEIRLVVCAAPAYLASHGEPVHPEQLAGHRCIAWAALGPVPAWEFQLAPGSGQPERLVPIRPRFETTTPESAVAAAIEGFGLVQATSYQLAGAVARGALLPVLCAYEPAPVPVSLVYPSKRLMPARLRAFLDFAAPRLTQRLAELAATL